MKAWATEELVAKLISKMSFAPKIFHVALSQKIKIKVSYLGGPLLLKNHSHTSCHDQVHTTPKNEFHSWGRSLSQGLG
jgi:hypothetical protein